MVERLTPEDKLSWDLHYVEHKQRYEFFNEYYNNAKVLDAACGIGYGSAIISKTAKSVLGIDISDEAVAYGKEYFQKANVYFKVFDCNSLSEINEKFDIVTSFETIEHLANPDIFIAGVKTVLQKDGYFFCSIPNIYRHKLAGIENEHHLSEMPLEEFLKKLEVHFNVEKVFYQNESPEFERYLRLVKHYDLAINQQFKKVSKSVLFKFENKVRSALGRKNVKFSPFNSYAALGQSLENDFVIKEYAAPSSWQKTFIVIARPKQ